MTRLACMTALFLCLGGGAFADEASNRDAAIRDAPETLALLRLPEGATRVDENPAVDPALLDQGNIGDSSSPNKADESEYWRVPGHPWDVFAWLKKHPPAGTELGGYGGGGTTSGGQTSWNVTFRRRPIREVLAYRELVIAVARASGGGTAIRADGVATWLVPRPASSAVPAGVRTVQVTIRGGTPKHAERFAVTDAKKVALVTRMLNRLPLVQPTQTVISCALDRGIRAHLSFRDGRGAVLAAATAQVGGCSFVDLTIGGEGQPQLFGWGLFDNLQAVVGPIDLGPFIGTEGIVEPTPVARIAHGRFSRVPFDVVAFNGGPRSGICVDLFVAGVDRSGIGCLLHLRGKRTTTVLGPACYPRQLTAFAVIGKAAATTKVHFEDGQTLLGRVVSLPHPTVETTIGLVNDQIVRLKHPAKAVLGYRGPFAIGVRNGMQPLGGGFSLIDYC